MAGISNCIRAPSRWNPVDAIYKARRGRTGVSAYYIVLVEKPADPAEIAEYRRLAMPMLKNRAVKFHTRPACELHTVKGDESNVAIELEYVTVQYAKTCTYYP